MIDERLDRGCITAQIYSTSRYGAWGVCSCGWATAVQPNAASASLAWALHIRQSIRHDPQED